MDSQTNPPEMASARAGALASVSAIMASVAMMAITVPLNTAMAQTFSEVPQSGGVNAPSLPGDLNFGGDSPDLKDVDFGDLDGDGDLDIYVFASDREGASEHLDRILLNGNVTGTPGAFFEIPLSDALGNPLIPSSEFDSTDIAFLTTGQRTYDGDLVDVDGDGDLDVLRTDISGAYLLLNNGNATFEFEPTLMPSKLAIETGAGIANFDGIGAVGSIYFDGVDTADFDGDGDLDAIVTSYNAGENLYLINCWNSPGGGASRCLASEGFAIGNVDGDVFDTLSADQTHGVVTGNIDIGVAPDLPDVFVTNTTSGVSSKLLRNTGLSGDGTGRVIFVDVTGANMPAGALNERTAVDAELSDLDADGDLDLYVVNRNQDNTLYWNNGVGVFTALGAGLPALPAGDVSTYDLVVADFDDDGDLDVMEAQGESGSATINNRLLLNAGGTNGGMSFVVDPLPFGPAPSHRLTISAGDFDGDTDIDIVGGDFASTNVFLYENNLYDPVDQDIDLVVTVDKTGSMLTDDRIGLARSAAKSVFGAKNGTDRIALSQFVTDTPETQVLLDLAANPNQFLFDLVVDGIVADGGATSAGSSLAVSLEALTDPMLQIPFKPRAMLIITDGQHNTNPLPGDVINADYGGVWPTGINYNVVSIANQLNEEFSNIVTHGSNFYYSEAALDLVEYAADAESDSTGKLVLDVQTASGLATPISRRDASDLNLKAAIGLAQMGPNHRRLLTARDGHVSAIEMPARQVVRTHGDPAPWSMDFAVPQSAIGVLASAEKPVSATLAVYNNRMQKLGETRVKVGTQPGFIGMRSSVPNIVAAKLTYDGDAREVVHQVFQHPSSSQDQPIVAGDDVTEFHVFQIVSDDRQFRASLTWENAGSSASLTLIDPAGNEIDPANDPRVDFNGGSVFQVIKVKRPTPGVWTAVEQRPRDERTFVSVLATSGPVNSSGLEPADPVLFDVSPAAFQNFPLETLLIDVTLPPGSRGVFALVEDPEGRLFELDAADLGDGNFVLALDDTRLTGAYDFRVFAEIGVASRGGTRTATRRISVPVSSPEQGEVCDALSSLSADASGGVADGQGLIELIAKFIDCDGNPVRAEPSDIQFATTLGDFVGEVKQLEEGVFSRLLLAPTVPGTAVVDTSIDGRRILPTASIDYVVGAVDPDATEFKLANSEGYVNVGGAATANIEVIPADSAGNRLGPNEDVQISIAPQSTVGGDIIGPNVSADGVYAFQVVLSAPFPPSGTLVVAGEVNGVPLSQTVSAGIVDADDIDGDGFEADVDNCLTIANPNQIDADGDGFGNACDADLDNNCNTDFDDLAALKQLFFGNDPVADLNTDGNVDFGDLSAMKQLFFMVPGPSALSAMCNGA